MSLKDENTRLNSDIENLEMDENLVLQGKMSDMAEVRRRKETRNCSLLTRLWKVTDTLRRKNNTLETENELLYESDEVDQVDIDLGRLVKKDILGHTHSVLKNSSCKSLLTQETAKVRKTPSHVNIVKFHHSFTEKSSVRCYVLEPLEIATGTFADVAQQRARNLREFNIWRFLSHLSSGLAYLHSQPARQVLPVDLSPHTVINVYRTEEEKKAHLATPKLLLLGTATKESLAQREVLSDLF